MKNHPMIEDQNMKVLAAICISLCVFSAKAQVHYVPAQILIPTLNLSAFHGLPNNNSTWYNNNTTGWNRPPFNTTGFYNITTINGDLIVGSVGYLDRLLFNQEYYKPERWYSGREKIIEYPKDVPGGYVRHGTISAVRVYNKFHDGLASRARIISGGVGYRYVKIQLKSNWGKGFRYLVQIFGH